MNPCTRMSLDYDILVQVQEELLEISEDNIVVIEELIYGLNCMEHDEVFREILRLLFGVVNVRPQKTLLYADLCYKLSNRSQTTPNYCDVGSLLISEIQNIRYVTGAIWWFYNACISYKIISKESTRAQLQLIDIKHTARAAAPFLSHIFNREHSLPIHWKPERLKDFRIPGDLMNTHYSRDTVEWRIIQDDAEAVKEVSANSRIRRSKWDVALMPGISPTLIQFSAFYGATETFKWLMINGADIDAPAKEQTKMRNTKYGAISLTKLADFAVAGGKTEIVRTLHDAGVDFSECFNVAAYYHRNAIFDWLREIYPTCCETQVTTVLQAAIQTDNLYVFGILIEEKIAPESLKLLLRFKRYAMIRWLLRKEMVVREEVLKMAIKCGDRALCSDMMQERVNDDMAYLATGGLARAVEAEQAGIVNLILSDQNMEVCSMFNGVPHLIRAMSAGNMDIFSLLLESPLIDPNMGKDQAPLQYAVSNKLTDCVRVMLANPRVNVNVRSMNNGTTPFLLAVTAGLEIFDMINTCENIERSSSREDGKNALHIALEQPQNDEICNILFQIPEIDVSAISNTGETILHSVVSSNSNFYSLRYIITRLLDQIDINALDSEGNTALVLAITKFGWSPAATILLSSPLLNVHVYYKNEILLVYLLRNEIADGVEAIQEHPSFISNISNVDIYDIIVEAAKNNRTSVISRLLKIKTLDFRTCRKSGLTLLHFMARELNGDVVKMLIDAGCDVNALTDDEDQMTACHLAARCTGSMSLVTKFLNPYRYSSDTWSRIFMRFVDANPNLLNVQDAHGCTPLHYAFEHASFDYNFLRYIDINVRYDLTNDKGENVFHMVARCGCVKLIDKILTAYPELLNSRTKEGRTPLHYAATRGKIDFIAQMTIRDGLERCPKDNNGLTPLDVTPKDMYHDVNFYFPIEL